MLYLTVKECPQAGQKKIASLLWARLPLSNAYQKSWLAHCEHGFTLAELLSDFLYSSLSSQASSTVLLPGSCERKKFWMNSSEPFSRRRRTS